MGKKAQIKIYRLLGLLIKQIESSPTNPSKYILILFFICSLRKYSKILWMSYLYLYLIFLFQNLFFYYRENNLIKKKNGRKL